MAAEAPLKMDPNHLTSKDLDMKDKHVASSLALFMLDNVIRRNLLTCAEGAKSVDPKDAAPYATWANYTLEMVQDHFESTNTIWFSAFASYNPQFNSQIEKQKQLSNKVEGLKSTVKAAESSGDSAAWEKVSAGFTELSGELQALFTENEQLSNSLGHSVPIKEVKALESTQEKRQKENMKKHGNMWSAVYLLRSLKPEERNIFPPGMPSLVKSGMMTSGAVQYRRELAYAPKF